MPLIIATTLRERGETGVHTHIRQLQMHLKQRNTTASLVTPLSQNRAAAIPIFAVSTLLRPLSGSATVAWYLYWHRIFLCKALSRLLAQTNECVIYAQSPTAAHAALKARKGPHQRVVLAVHFNGSYALEFAISGYIRHGGLAYRSIKRAEATIIPRTDGIVYVSNAAREQLLSWLPEAASVHSAVINNFVGSPSASSAEAAGAELVSVGALRPLKNHRFLLQVLAEARQAGRIITLDVFGVGSCQKELIKLTCSLGLETQVRWRGFRADVASLLSSYKVYVHASLSEALPLALVEALAAGLPIVAGDVGGISEMGESGLEIRFWPLDDPAKAATILTELLDCEPTRLKAAAAASARFHLDFDAQVLGDRLASFLMDAESTAPTGN